MSDNQPAPRGVDPEGPAPAAPPSPVSPWAVDRSGTIEPAAPEEPGPEQRPSPQVPAVGGDTQPLTRPGPAATPGESAYQQRSEPAWDGSGYQPRSEPWDGSAYQQRSEPSWDGGDQRWSVAGPAVDTLGRPERARRGGAGVVVLAVVLALVAGLVGGLVGGFAAQRSDVAGLVGLDPASDDEADPSGGAPEGSAADEAVAVDPPAPGELGSVADIAAQVLPSVVSIRVRADGGSGTGSGFVIDESGLIVTNNHVIRAGADTVADDIVVELSDGSQAAAEVVGADESYDVAVLRIDPAEVGQALEALPWGDSDAVVVGEQVVAVGAPLGLDATVTTGIVSALNRPVSAGDSEQTAFINAIQTDAAINPGNSGGPLVNLRGEVVGVNSAIAQAPGGQAGGSIGLGFSIPSNQAERTAGQLVDTGVATYPVVGVLLDRTYDGEGVRIVTDEDTTDTPPITPGGPAEVAGLRPGDVILAFDGRPMTESDELVVAIRAREPGDEVTLTVRREEEVFDVALVLEAGEQG